MSQPACENLDESSTPVWPACRLIPEAEAFPPRVVDDPPPAHRAHVFGLVLVVVGVRHSETVEMFEPHGQRVHQPKCSEPSTVASHTQQMTADSTSPASEPAIPAVKHRPVDRIMVDASAPNQGALASGFGESISTWSTTAPSTMSASCSATWSWRVPTYLAAT